MGSPRRPTGLCAVAATVVAFSAGCSSAPTAAPVPAARAVTWGFTAPWDPRSDSSVRAHSGRLDAVVSGWMELDSVTGAPRPLYADRAVVAQGTARFALVSSYSGGRFRPEVVRRAVADDTTLGELGRELGRLVSDSAYSGIVFDFEEQTPDDVVPLLHGLRIIGDSARRHGATTIAVAIPAADTAAYPTRPFAAVADALVIMLYDEHWTTSDPGPIASPRWVRQTLARRVADIGPDRLVAALPVYGYRWGATSPADVLSYDAAQRAAADAGVEISRDPVSRSLHAALPGQWNLWVSDAELLRTLRAEAAALGVTHFALWRLGQEDPAIWGIIGK